jgi:aminopeptidase N
MTDRMAALSCLAETTGPQRDEAISHFYEANKTQPLNLLKWLRVQTASNVPGNLPAVKALVEHPDISLTNPNSCYSLFLGFCASVVNFHAGDGSGYEFMGDMVLKVSPYPLPPWIYLLTVVPRFGFQVTYPLS